MDVTQVRLIVSDFPVVYRALADGWKRLVPTLARLPASRVFAELLNEPRPGAGGHTYVFVHPRSTGGVLLELIQK